MNFFNYFILYFVFSSVVSYFLNKFIFKKYCALKGCNNIYCKSYKICPYSKYISKHDFKMMVNKFILK